jgi:hypothetical protein
VDSFSKTVLNIRDLSRLKGYREYRLGGWRHVEGSKFKRLKELARF